MIDLVISDAELVYVDKPELLALVQSRRDELAFKQIRPGQPYRARELFGRMADHALASAGRE